LANKIHSSLEMPQTSLHSPHKTQILDALQFQGDRNDCGPYTVATVLNALLGLNLEASQLAKEMDRPIWRGPMFIVRRVPNWATFPWGMVDVFCSYGLKSKWKSLVSTEYLLKEITHPKVLIPIIGSWKPLWAHVMSLVAVDPDKGWGFANTQYNHHNIHWLQDSTFKTQWKAMFHLFIEVKIA